MAVTSSTALTMRFARFFATLPTLRSAAAALVRAPPTGPVARFVAFAGLALRAIFVPRVALVAFTGFAALASFLPFAGAAAFAALPRFAALTGFAAGLRPAVFFAVLFFAVDFFAADFFAAGFFTAAFFAADFLVADFFAVDFLAAMMFLSHVGAMCTEARSLIESNASQLRGRAGIQSGVSRDRRPMRNQQQPRPNSVRHTVGIFRSALATLSCLSPERVDTRPQRSSARHRSTR
jgi:hypothetical protein